MCFAKYFPSSVFRQVRFVKCFSSNVFRQVFFVKCFPSSVFRQVSFVKRFSSSVCRQQFSSIFRSFVARQGISSVTVVTLKDGGVFRSIGIFFCFCMFLAPNYPYLPLEKQAYKILRDILCLEGGGRQTTVNTNRDS